MISVSIGLVIADLLPGHHTDCPSYSCLDFVLLSYSALQLFRELYFKKLSRGVERKVTVRVCAGVCICVCVSVCNRCFDWHVKGNWVIDKKEWTCQLSVSYKLIFAECSIIQRDISECECMHVYKLSYEFIVATFVKVIYAKHLAYLMIQLQSYLPVFFLS